MWSIGKLLFQWRHVRRPSCILRRGIVKKRPWKSSYPVTRIAILHICMKQSVSGLSQQRCTVKYIWIFVQCTKIIARNLQLRNTQSWYLSPTTLFSCSDYFIENVKYYTTQNTPSCLTGTQCHKCHPKTAKLVSLNWYKFMHILVKSFHVSSYVGIQKCRNVEMQK